MKRVWVWQGLSVAFLVCAVWAMGAMAQQPAVPGSGPPAIRGSGTQNRIAKFTNTTEVGDSAIFESGVNIGIGTITPTTKLHVAGTVTASSFSTGAANAASGFNALQNNTTGVDNAATGVQALRDNTTGFSNTASGDAALIRNTSGNFNTAVGGGALAKNTTGDNNTAIGFGAGGDLTTGRDNIYVNNPGPPAAAAGVESNTIRIGTIQTSTFIAGIDGVDLGSGDTVVVNAGQLGIIASSRRLKDDIRDMGEASSRLMQLRPVTFHYKKENAGGARPLRYGLIAEEVAKVYPELVGYSTTGEAYTVRYHLMNTLLLNEVQKQNRQIQGHQKEIVMQQKEIAALMARLARLEALEAERGSFAAQTK